jgi:hypothetical protein
VNPWGGTAKGKNVLNNNRKPLEPVFIRAAVVVVAVVVIYFLRYYIVGALALVGAYYLLKLHRDSQRRP